VLVTPADIFWVGVALVLCRGLARFPLVAIERMQKALGVEEQRPGLGPVLCSIAIIFPVWTWATWAVLTRIGVLP
jgi:hypothetical protein